MEDANKKLSKFLRAKKRRVSAGARREIRSSELSLRQVATRTRQVRLPQEEQRYLPAEQGKGEERQRRLGRRAEQAVSQHPAAAGS